MRQNISVLMDGELDDNAASQLIDVLSRDREALHVWRAYHLIGDALRDNPPLSAEFGARVARQLEREPAVMAARRLQPQPRTWYALAASVAAVALVGWLGFAPSEQAPAPVATAEPQTTLRAKPASVPLPRGTNDYLFAHQGFSPRMSLQGMAPYVRTVSEQGRESRK